MKRRLIDPKNCRCRRAKFLPSVVGVVYDWMQIQGHLGNVDLFTVRAMLCSEAMMG